MINTKKKSVPRMLLQWADMHARSFPWRRADNLTPYRILLAELLLKRTTAGAASRVYQSFLRKYPTLDDLSHATKDELEVGFQALGLQKQRAELTIRLTAYLNEEHADIIPDTLEELNNIPGIGPYSARAILSFGFGKPYAVVDGNVIRILNRAFAQEVDITTPIAEHQSLADSLISNDHHRQFNFGIIDLGSLICRPRNPRCGDCPLRTVCDYTNTEPIQAELSAASSKVRNARVANGMSLVRLSSLSGVSKLTIVNIEKGRTKPKVETIEKLLRALG